MKEDLRLPFPIELQNPHVIATNQVCISALSVGSTGKSLNSSFGNRENSAYKVYMSQFLYDINYPFGYLRMNLAKRF